MTIAEDKMGKGYLSCKNKHTVFYMYNASVVLACFPGTQQYNDCGLVAFLARVIYKNPHCGCSGVVHTFTF